MPDNPETAAAIRDTLKDHARSVKVHHAKIEAKTDAFLAGIAALVFSFPALSLAVSAMFILLMSGFILYQTSQLVHEPNTNYILATVGLYVSIYNLFTSLLYLFGIFGGDD